MMPDTPVERARLAFLALGLMSVVLAWIQLSVVADDSDLQVWAVLAVATLLLAWNQLYRKGRPAWWLDLAVAGSVLVYLAALPLPDLGLGIVYVAVYIAAFYGNRLQTARAVLLIVGAYVAAEINIGALESEVIRLFMYFQLPALLVTAAILRILHESLRTQESLSEQVERLIRMESVIRLTGGVAHDFNNLLTAILGSLELARSELDDPGELKQDLDRARESTLSARSLTAQLLAFSRTAAVDPVEIRIDSRLEELEPEFRRILGPGIELELELSGDDPVVLMDPAAFDESIRELLANARQALKDHDEDPSVLLRVRRCPLSEVPSELVHGDPGVNGEPPDYVAVTVEDTGPGMASDVRERAFDPFFTTHAGQTGLGLSTVYGTVTRAGGQVTLGEAERGGLGITLYLPIHDGNGPSEGPLPAGEPPSKASNHESLGLSR